MTWKYEITTGTLTHDGLKLGVGYSGTHEGRDNPKMVDVHNVGPTPPGFYAIDEARDDPGGLGPCVMNLDPEQGTNTFGRSLFRIHGDNSNHDASHGCIILGPAMRRAIAQSHDKELEVVE